MELFSGGIGLLQSGGPVMFILLAMSVLSIAIILMKAVHFQRVRLRQTEFIDNTVSALRRGDDERAKKVLKETKHPVARVFRERDGEGSSEERRQARPSLLVLRYFDFQCHQKPLALGGKPAEVLTQIHVKFGLKG